MMTRSKRIQEDSEKKEIVFPKVADGILTKKDKASRKVEVPTDENPVANKEGENEVVTLP